MTSLKGLTEKDNAFFDRDMYLFVLDTGGTYRAFGGNPAKVGTGAGHPWRQGQQLLDDIMAQAARGTGWVSTTSPTPRPASCRPRCLMSAPSRFRRPGAGLRRLQELDRHLIAVQWQPPCPGCLPSPTPPRLRPACFAALQAERRAYADAYWLDLPGPPLSWAPSSRPSTRRASSSWSDWFCASRAGSSDADARALARGERERFAAWRVLTRRELSCC